MYELIEFFEPLDVGPWLVKVILLYTLSYIVVWIGALILCRFRWFYEGSVIVRVYFGWLVSLTLHSIIFMVFLLASAKYYKELGISLWFCVAYLLPVFLSGLLGLDLSMRIQKKLIKEGR